jgi:hypothetical protein
MCGWLVFCFMLRLEVLHEWVMAFGLRATHINIPWPQLPLFPHQHQYFSKTDWWTRPWASSAKTVRLSIYVPVPLFLLLLFTPPISCSTIQKHYSNASCEPRIQSAYTQFLSCLELGNFRKLYVHVEWPILRYQNVMHKSYFEKCWDEHADEKMFAEPGATGIKLRSSSETIISHQTFCAFTKAQHTKQCLLFLWNKMSSLYIFRLRSLKTFELPAGSSRAL